MRLTAIPELIVFGIDSRKLFPPSAPKTSLRVRQPCCFVQEHRILRSASSTSCFLSLPASHAEPDRKSTRLNSSHLGISYAVFCSKKSTAQRAFTRIYLCRGPPSRWSAHMHCL